MKPAEYLHKAIDLCHEHGALFIQDEMITGFKSDFPGSISKFNTKPDMATWGKGIANGFSFCALTGTREVMELGGIKKEGAEKLFLISTTHGGETSAIAAGLATIKEFQEKDVIRHDHAIGDYLIQQLNDVIKSHQLNNHIEVSPNNWLIAFGFRNKEGQLCQGMRTLMMQEMIARGVLFQGAFVPCFSHSREDIDFFMKCFIDSLDTFKKAVDEGYEIYLVGEPAKAVFRKYL